MSLTGPDLHVHFGPAVPSPMPPPLASADLMGSIQQVTIRQQTQDRSTFEMAMSAERSTLDAKDYALLQSGPDRVLPGMRIVFAIRRGGQVDVLFDGVVTTVRLEGASGDQPPTIVAQGEDLTQMMDLLDIGIAWPAMPVIARVEAILAKYAVWGVVPMVVPPLTMLDPDPLEHTPVQQDTDYGELMRLAQQHGHVFCLIPGPSPGRTVAYWGPEPRLPLASPTLNIDMGVSSNARIHSFGYAGLAPRAVAGLVLQDGVMEPVPVPIFAPPIDPVPLTRQQAPTLHPQMLRTRYMQAHGGDALRVEVKALAEAMNSTLRSATAQGQLDGARYGGTLRPWGVVGVRGAGHSFDGMWTVGEVTHQIQPGHYSQSFELHRSGLESTFTRLPT